MRIIFIFIFILLLLVNVHAKIAIIGCGISGLSLAHYLIQDNYQIEIFEKESYCGGHNDKPNVGPHGSRLVFSNFKRFNKILKEIPFLDVNEKVDGTVYDQLQLIFPRIVKNDKIMPFYKTIEQVFLNLFRITIKINFLNGRNFGDLISKLDDNDQSYINSVNKLSWGYEGHNWSKNTGIRLLNEIITLPYSFPGSSYNFLIYPWVTHLKNNGVKIHYNTTIHNLTGFDNYDRVIIATQYYDTLLISNRTEKILEHDLSYYDVCIFYLQETIGNYVQLVIDGDNMISYYPNSKTIIVLFEPNTKGNANYKQRVKFLFSEAKILSNKCIFHNNNTYESNWLFTGNPVKCDNNWIGTHCENNEFVGATAETAVSNAYKKYMEISNMSLIPKASKDGL
jgi:hypothetical protein